MATWRATREIIEEKLKKGLRLHNTWTNSSKCKYMKEWRRRPIPLSFYLSSYFLSSLFWLSGVFTCDQDQPLKTMKTYQVQGRLHNKEETTIEAWRWSSRKQACEDLEQSIQVEELSRLFCPTIDPNGKSQDYLVFSIFMKLGTSRPTLTKVERLT